ncbi:MAG TPA: DUF4233 domain-containing protein [Pseudonocardiaceae bacterium]|jgi:hypothetical protein|nr:DUF4233 domain-containing protein [Pseudonocardiaceae bacterium]
MTEPRNENDTARPQAAPAAPTKAAPTDPAAAAPAAPTEAAPTAPAPAESTDAASTKAASAELTSAEPTSADAAPAAAPQVDPMKGFRGVMAGTLVLEAIVVALALLVVAKLYGGLATAAGIIVGVVVVVLLVTCALLRHSWSVWMIAIAQLALIGCAFGSPAVAAIGVLFALVWGWLLWARRDVARRMAAGRLPSQRPSEQSE